MVQNGKAQAQGKQPTIEELMATIAGLKAQLETKANSKISLKVSEKGAVSAYGLGRFPITLYKTQWERLLEEKETILDFIGMNIAKLSVK